MRFSRKSRKKVEKKLPGGGGREKMQQIVGLRLRLTRPTGLERFTISCSRARPRSSGKTRAGTKRPGRGWGGLPAWEGGHPGRHAGWKPALLQEERDALGCRKMAGGRANRRGRPACLPRETRPRRGTGAGAVISPRRATAPAGLRQLARRASVSDKYDASDNGRRRAYAPPSRPSRARSCLPSTRPRSDFPSR